MDDAALIRMCAFASILVVMAVLEALFPRRVRVFSRSFRWLSNLLIFLSGAIIGRLLVFAGMGAAALYAQSAGLGLFNVMALPDIMVILLAIIALDYAVWVQHVATHKIPILWRLHRMHHSDVDLDVTSGLRFHPAEIMLSLLYKSAVVLALGAPLLAVLVYEVMLNGLAMFNHANVRLPKTLDGALRMFIVTPDMHRVHHSIHRDETDSNYGNFLSLWDRLFRTYKPDLRDGQIEAKLGLPAFRDRKDQGVLALLFQPFYRVPDQPQ